VARAAHTIHPYSCRFIPAVPARLIATLSQPGDLVFDPFCGCGTTTLEAVVAGRRAAGTDANPIGLLASRVKTGPYDHAIEDALISVRQAVARQHDALLNDYSSLTLLGNHVPAPPKISHWFSDQAILELSNLRAVVEAQPSGPARDILRLSFSRTIRPASHQAAENRHVAEPPPVPHAPGHVTGLWLKSLDYIVERLRIAAGKFDPGAAQHCRADTQDLSHTAPESFSAGGAGSVDLIITSPPYGNVTDYYRDHRLRLFWLGHDPKSLRQLEFAGSAPRPKQSAAFEAYRDGLGRVMAQLHRVLRPGGHAALVMGDVLYNQIEHCGRTLIHDAARPVGFEPIGDLRHTLHPTRRSFPVAGRRATEEFIVILRKP